MAAALRGVNTTVFDSTSRGAGCADASTSAVNTAFSDLGPASKLAWSNVTTAVHVTLAWGASVAMGRSAGEVSTLLQVRGPIGRLNWVVLKSTFDSPNVPVLIYIAQKGGNTTTGNVKSQRLCIIQTEQCPTLLPTTFTDSRRSRPAAVR